MTTTVGRAVRPTVLGGVPFGDVLPPGWTLGRLRDIAALTNGFPFDSERFSLSTGVPLIRIRDLLPGRTETYYDGSVPSDSMVEDGDILIGMDGDFNVVRWTGGRAALNQRLCRIRPGQVLDASFLFYVLPAALRTINDLTYFTTVKHLSSPDIMRIRVPLPPLSVQRAIADYLDRETARIDALVAKKRRLIELLEEQRAAEASERLLGGPPVPGAGPGPDQGRFPAHWRRVPFRWLFREVDERSDTGAETLLSVSQTRGVIPQADLGDRHQHAETYVGYKLCQAGDLVINRMWVYYGALGISPMAGMVSPDYAVFRGTDAKVSPDLVAQLLKTPAYVGEMTRRVRGIGVAFQGTVRKPRLHPRDLGRIEIPVPPHDERDSILIALE